MSISILVEPAASGFRAVSGAPLDFSAEADTAAGAVDALRSMIATRLNGGAMLIEQSVPSHPSPVPILPLSENPLFDRWLEAVEEYRVRQDAEERSREREAD